MGTYKFFIIFCLKIVSVKSYLNPSLRPGPEPAFTIWGGQIE
jgi:hypothetical protein